MFLFATVVFALHALGRAQSETNSSSTLPDVVAAFNEARIVPDVIPTFNPNAGLSPIFVGSSGFLQVLPNMSFAVNDTQAPPQYLLASNSTDLSTSNASWVIAIVDPDAPSPQFLHFLGKDFVVDPNLVVEGGVLANASGLMNTSQALVEFVGPNPPSSDSAHRYVVLVYQQPSDFNITAPAFFSGMNGTDFRQNFSISAFATNTSLGDPIAGTFFLVGSADTSTTTMAPSSTTSMSPPSTSPSLSIVTPPPSPSSPPPSPPQEPPPTTTVVPSGGEKVASWMSLLIATTLCVAAMKCILRYNDTIETDDRSQAG